MDNESLSLPETDVRRIVGFLGQVAVHDGGIEGKKRLLMRELSSMIGADAWMWIVSRASNKNDNPAVVACLHDGVSPQEFAAHARTMQDRDQTPVEYKALNDLRRTHDRFTRSWDQLVSPAQWYSEVNNRRLKAIGFEHILYSVRILDSDGLFSGISLKRRTGRPNFSAQERRIAHIVLSEVDWLHHNQKLAQRSKQVRPLSPQMRTVLILLLDGMSVKEAANNLELKYNTVNTYTRDIYRHFGVHSRLELSKRLREGDGRDLA